MSLLNYYYTTTSILVLIGTWLWLRYKKNEAMLGGMPGYKQLLSHKHVLVMSRLLPKQIFGWTWMQFDANVYWEMKWKEMFEPLKQDIAAFTFLFGKPIVAVADAALAKRITGNRTLFMKPTELYESVNIFGKNVVSAEGDAWRRHRKVSATSFSDNNNRLVHEITLRQCLGMMQSWHENTTGESAVVRVDDAMVKLTMHVISGAGFGYELDWSKDSAIASGHTFSFKEALETVTNNLMMRLAVPEWLLGALPFHQTQRIYKGFKEFEQYITEFREDTKIKIAEQTEGADLLTALVQASITADDQGNPILSDNEVNGNSFIFLLAGHETTAHALIFAFALLAVNPEEQYRAFKEVEAAIGNSLPTFENFSALHYCLCIFFEALRLFPPVTFIPKVCTEDVDFGKYHVQAGTQVDIAVAALHRNPTYWGDDAETFRPARFDTREGKTYPRDAFLPFSDGMRGCIGKRFAQVEAVCILATLLQRYEISLADESDRDKVLEALPYLTTTPVHPVNLKFTRRRIVV